MDSKYNLNYLKIAKYCTAKTSDFLACVTMTDNWPTPTSEPSQAWSTFTDPYWSI